MTETQDMGEELSDPLRLRNLEAQLETIIERLDVQMDTSRLWTLADVARYMSVSEMSARRIMSQTGAPKCVRIPTSKKTKSTPRWVANEVIEFALRRAHREKRVINY